jgi:release factor glutamine methyltransferase
MDRPLDEGEKVGARDLLVRRAAHEPVAYILGFREFMGRPFEVGPGVLIPRPETELLVERAAAELTERFPAEDQLRVLEVGIGSGAVAVSLCHLVPRVVVVATECSPEAAEVARRNAKALGVASRLEIHVTDGLDAVEGPVHAVVSNPPYVTEAEYRDLMADVRDFEPRVALVGGADGLDVARMILREAPRLLAPRGFVLMELSPMVMPGLAAAAESAGMAVHEVIKDYAGHERHVLLEQAAEGR